MLKIYSINENEVFLDSYKKRQHEISENIEKTVSEIIQNVKIHGDKALFEYTTKFDKISLNSFKIPQNKLKEALENSPIRSSLEKAAENIREFHKKQLQTGFSIEKDNGSVVGRRVLPLEKVGIYVPGGTAAYPSSVLMNAIPAKVANVGQIIMVTPPPKSEDETINILAAASISGVDQVYYCGGAQAMAALAFGTETFPKVDKIVGPGNIFVATAKKQLFGTVDIDMIAGPSEILVIADKNAPAEFIAADLLSQAEHDMLASSILICFSQKKAEEVNAEIIRQTKTLPRAEIIKKSLSENGAAVICENLEKAVEMANIIAPEHLELCIDNPFLTLEKIRNAGSVFLGNYSPEPLGDYFAGPNHVLPTSGTARFFSPLSVESFTKTSSFIYYTKEALADSADDIIAIAEAENFSAHANSIKIRQI